MEKIKLDEGVYTVSLAYADEPIRWDASFFKECDLEELRVPEGATTLADKAFCFCTKLRKIYLPESIAFLGDSLFYGTYAPIEIYYPLSAERFRELAAIRRVEREVQVPGAYDHQPYCNSEGTYYKKEVVSEYFHKFSKSCLVHCADGECLNY